MRQPSTQHLVALILCSVVCLISASPLPQPAGNQELDVLQIPLANGKVSSIKLALTAVNAFVNSHNSFHANEKNIHLSASILYIFTTYPYIHIFYNLHIFLISYIHNIHRYSVYTTLSWIHSNDQASSKYLQMIRLHFQVHLQQFPSSLLT